MGEFLAGIFTEEVIAAIVLVLLQSLLKQLLTSDKTRGVAQVGMPVVLQAIQNNLAASAGG